MDTVVEGLLAALGIGFGVSIPLLAFLLMRLILGI
jgi:hypothetical protein